MIFDRVTTEPLNGGLVSPRCDRQCHVPNVPFAAVSAPPLGRSRLERSEVERVRVTAARRSIWANSFSDYQWEDPANGPFLPNGRLDILLARIAIDPQHNGYYGDLSGAHIGMEEEHGFKIEIFSRTYVQSKDLYVKVPHHRQDIAIYGTYHGSRFFLVENGEASFMELAERMKRRPSRRTVWDWIIRRH
jgi:hypothetical protein